MEKNKKKLNLGDLNDYEKIRGKTVVWEVDKQLKDFISGGRTNAKGDFLTLLKRAVHS